MRAATYYRIDEAECSGRNHQETRCREWAEQMGWTIVSNYSDEGSPGSTDLSGMAALLSDADKGKFDWVIVEDMQTLSADDDKRARVIEAIQSRNVMILFADEPAERRHDTILH